LFDRSLDHRLDLFTRSIGYLRGESILSLSKNPLVLRGFFKKKLSLYKVITMPSTDRATAWSVTINNPNASDEENMASARQLGWVVDGQLEKGDNGTPHFQMMLRTPQVRFSQVKKMFPRGHIEIARNVVALGQYVRKEETRVGELPKSERYVTSQTAFLALVVDTLEKDERVNKQNRVRYDEKCKFYDPAGFIALRALDDAVSCLIYKGYYCVESFAVNPAIRKLWDKFYIPIISRRQTDRQTEEKIISEGGITEDASTQTYDETEEERDSQESESSGRGSASVHSGDEGDSCSEGSEEDSDEDDGQED